PHQTRHPQNLRRYEVRNGRRAGVRVVATNSACRCAGHARTALANRGAPGTRTARLFSARPSPHAALAAGGDGTAAIVARLGASFRREPPAIGGCFGVWRGVEAMESKLPRGYSFSDAAGVLLTLLRDGTMQGVERCRLAAGIAVTDESAWLRLDAFAALRLAMEAPTETLQRTESKRAETVALMLQAAS